MCCGKKKGSQDNSNRGQRPGDQPDSGSWRRQLDRYPDRAREDAEEHERRVQEELSALGS